MDARRGLRQSFYCQRCLLEFLVPEKSIIGPSRRCPHCGSSDFFWGTWEAFMVGYAATAKSLLAEEAGKAVAKFLKRRRN